MSCPGGPRCTCPGGHTVPPLHEAPVFAWIRRHALLGCGVARVTLAEMQDAARRKRCAAFDAARNARLQIGHLRYGASGVSRDASYDVVASMIRRLEEYRATGNLEHLVDVANLAEIEFIWPRHANPNWNAQDTGGHWSLRNQQT